MIKAISILFLVLIVSSYGQNNKCSECGKEITASYLLVQGKYFHPGHFLCNYCKKAIEKEYIYDESEFYHNECFIKHRGLLCDFCKDPLNEEYFIEGSKKYHKKCYEFVAPKCKICNKLLEGYITKDDFGNQYHSSHLSQYTKCCSCGRMICEQITKGGIVYKDGRNICNICYPNVAIIPEQIQALYRKVIAKMDLLGIKIGHKNITVTGVSLSELKKEAGKNYSNNMKGFCNYTSKSVNGAAEMERYKVFVLNGLLPLSIESVIAHELMHIWFYQNTKSNHTKMLLEGSCNYASFLYLNTINDSFKQKLINDLEHDNTFIYGEGFRYVKNMFHNKRIDEFLNYLKKNKS